MAFPEEEGCPEGATVQDARRMAAQQRNCEGDSSVAPLAVVEKI